MTKRRAAVIAVDIVVWALIVYLLVRPHDPYTRARACWHTTKACWAAAAWFGRWAIAAEQRYYVEMENAL